MKIVTIGGHGFTRATFVAALHAARVDTFVDLRRRRGMRGAAYAFLNRARLEALLARERIRYVYIPELAPTPAIRDLQRQADEAHHQTAHTRERLSPAYVRAYERDVLAHFDRAAFAARVGAASVVALFCVEGPPALCHRALVARAFAGGRARHLIAKAEGAAVSAARGRRAAGRRGSP
ncbi:MAG TPA: DUF488 family protein [Kofleriaceae bacterium]|nr:DUF488 family protein [Kofleriaceae bacterium]